MGVPTPQCLKTQPSITQSISRAHARIASCARAGSGGGASPDGVGMALRHQERERVYALVGAPHRAERRPW